MILLPVFFFITAVVQAQRISLSVKDQSLKRIFSLIERQSEYRFIYSEESLATAKPVTIEVSNAALRMVLDQCFRDQPLTYHIEKTQVIVEPRTIASPQPAAQRPFRGRVVNEEGEPLAGLTVQVKNSSQLTVTDGNGEFAFADIPAGAVIRITGAEIEALEEMVKGSSFSIITVKKKLNILDETIVIAYGKTTRRYATGTVSSVKSAEIARQPVSNILSALGGKVSGLQITPGSGVPGANQTVRIRGRNSLANGNDPLFIIDGVPFPSATLNGMMGGAAGVTSSPLDNFNPSDIESIEVLKDAAATSIYGSRGANGVVLITTKKGKPGRTGVGVKALYGIGGIHDRLSLMKTPDYLVMRREAFTNDNATPTLANAPDLLLWDTTRYTNWKKVLTGGTINTSDMTLSLSGGNVQTQFVASTGYRRETTPYPGNFYAQKFTGSLNVTHSSADQRLTVGLHSAMVINENKLPQSDLTGSITLAPNAPALYTADGAFNWEQSTWTNPLAEAQKTFQNRTENMMLNLSISYKLPLNLTFRLASGYSNISLKEHVRNPFSAQNPSQTIIASASFGNKSVATFIHEPQLLYSNRWEKHSAEVLAGGSMQQTVTETLYQTGSGYSSDDLLYSLKAASSINTAGEDYIRYRYSALFARLNYDYDRRYLLSLSARRDGSSRYGPANRFSNFVSLGSGWVISRENFLRRVDWISFAKLKLSAGTSGNDQIGDYRYLDLYTPYNYTYQGSTTFMPSQLFNPAFSWEKVTKLEAGLDIGCWADRWLFSINYYRNTTHNQLVTYALPNMTGFSGITRNIPAKILNTGWEFELNGDVLRSRGWKWSMSVNVTIPENKLLSFDDLEKSSYASQYAIGEPLSIAKRLFYTGIDEATGLYTFKDMNGDGKYTAADDYKSIVDMSQTCFGGWENTVEHGRMTLTVLLQFAAQPNQPSYFGRFTRPAGLANQPVDLLDRWRKPGDAATFQRYTISASGPSTAFSNYRQSDAVYSDASFARLKNIFFSYMLFPESAKSFLRGTRLTLQGQNLWTFTQFKNLDPETTGALPLPWILTGGVQINF